MTARRHRWTMDVGFHCLFLDDGRNNTVVEPDQTVGFVATAAGSVRVTTGLAGGPVDVRVQVADSPPAAPDGWAESAEMSVPFGIEPFFRLHATADQISDEQLVPKPAGRAVRLRVLANGRTANWDRNEPVEPEEYLIQLWSENDLRPGVTGVPAVAVDGPRGPEFLAALAAAQRTVAESATDAPQPAPGQGRP